MQYVVKLSLVVVVANWIYGLCSRFLGNDTFVWLIVFIWKGSTIEENHLQNWKIKQKMPLTLWYTNTLGEKNNIREKGITKWQETKIAQHELKRVSVMHLPFFRGVLEQKTSPWKLLGKKVPWVSSFIHRHLHLWMFLDGQYPQWPVEPPGYVLCF